MLTFTAAEKHRAIRREIEMRKSVYPRRVMAGQMSQKQADHQLALMEAIAADYAEMMQGERLL